MIDGVYLSYPIDNAPTDAYLYQRIDEFKTGLVKTDTANWVFDPGDAFVVNPMVEPSRGVAAINRHALVEADVVVAFLPRVPTVGVPIEIDRAYSHGKHIVVFTEPTMNPPWMLHYPGNRVAIFRGWEDEQFASALSWLREAILLPRTVQYRDLPVKVDELGGQMPKRAYDDDAGLDLSVSEDVVIPAGSFSDVPCGISVELPPGTLGWITGRSSALRKRGLLVHTGIIDEGYRGPLFAGVWNMDPVDKKVAKGERLAQLIILNNGTKYTTPVPTDALTQSARGSNGFGSSGA